MGLIFLKINIKKSHAVAQSTHRGTCTPNSALSVLKFHYISAIHFSTLYQYHFCFLKLI